MLRNAHVPIVGFAAYSGTGKTTLLRKLLPLLRARGLRIGVVKHAHHNFEMDHPGKDSYELRKAGATQMLIVSRHRWALAVDLPTPREPRLDEVLLELDQAALDLIIVEGFKNECFPKIEVRRTSLRAPPLHPTDRSIIALVTDDPAQPSPDLPTFALDATDAIADFIVAHLAIGR